MESLANKAAIEKAFKPSEGTIILGARLELDEGTHYAVSTGHVGQIDIKPKGSDTTYRIIAATCETAEGVRVNVTVRDANEALQLLESGLTVKFEVREQTSAAGSTYKTATILSKKKDTGENLDVTNGKTKTAKIKAEDAKVVD